MTGWEAGTRTPIRRSRVCSLTIRRPPKGSIRQYNNGAQTNAAVSSSAFDAITCAKKQGFKSAFEAAGLDSKHGSSEIDSNETTLAFGEACSD
jgi:hypothetical protein